MDIWTDGPEVEDTMKKTIIRSNVRIGERVFLLYRDCLPDGCRRYAIEETFVTDVSARHGFVLDLDEKLWRREDEVWQTVFFTLDGAVRSISGNEDYNGFCYHAADGSSWKFIRGSGEPEKYQP